ncbi:MAG TPA: DUF456 family protein [Dissulfurispiraceae bacterium]|nr:DUF456 family protein [Dissulfurispiraceae bacterium]
MNALLWVISLLLVIAGILGTVAPWLPGTPLVFGGLLLAAWIDGFEKVSVPTVVMLAVLTAVSVAVDFVSSSLGAKGSGASRKAVIGAATGTVVGLFFGIPGIVFGPFCGAVIGEYWSRRDLGQAGKAGLGTWLGFVFGTLVKVVLTFAMVGIFAAAYFL